MRHALGVSVGCLQGALTGLETFSDYGYLHLMSWDHRLNEKGRGESPLNTNIPLSLPPDVLYKSKFLQPSFKLFLPPAFLGHALDYGPNKIFSFLPWVAPGQAVTARRKVADIQLKEREVHFDSQFKDYGPSWLGSHDSYGGLVCDSKSLILSHIALSLMQSLGQKQIRLQPHRRSARDPPPEALPSITGSTTPPTGPAARDQVSKHISL